MQKSISDLGAEKDFLNKTWKEWSIKLKKIKIFDYVELKISLS